MHMVDDATTAALGRFSEEETIWAAAAVLRGWIEHYGVPGRSTLHGPRRGNWIKCSGWRRNEW